VLRRWEQRDCFASWAPRARELAKALATFGASLWQKPPPLPRRADRTDPAPNRFPQSMPAVAMAIRYQSARGGTGLTGRHGLFARRKPQDAPGSHRRGKIRESSTPICPANDHFSINDATLCGTSPLSTREAEIGRIGNVHGFLHRLWPVWGAALGTWVEELPESYQDKIGENRTLGAQDSVLGPADRATGA